MGILYDDFDILSKLNTDVDDAAMIFCANPEEIDLAFYRFRIMILIQCAGEAGITAATIIT